MKEKTRYILATLGFLLLAASLWYFNTLVAYILISVVFAFIGRPLVDYLGKVKIWRFQIPRGVSATIVLLLLWFFISLFFRIFLPLVANQADELSKIDVASVKENLQEPLLKIEELAEKYHLTPEGQSLEDYLTNKLISILNITFISNIFGSLANTLGNLFIAFFSISFMTFFFLKDEYLFGNALILIAPARFEDKVRKVLGSIKKLLMRYFIGIVVQITAIIILITIGLTIVGAGFEHALVIGLTVGIVNVVPYIGPIVGAIIGLIIGVATHLDLPFYTEMLPLLAYMAIVLATVQIIDNVLFQPLIYSNSVNAHPLEIFLVIMIAGNLAGVTGMILAIPSYTILRVIGKEFFNQFRVVKKLTENI